MHLRTLSYVSCSHAIISRVKNAQHAYAYQGSSQPIPRYASQVHRMQITDRKSSHRSWLLKVSSILSSPQRRNSLPLCIEPDTILSIEVKHSRSSNTSLVTSEGEHGKGDRDGNIDSNLPRLNALLEVRGARSGLGKDDCTVAPFVAVDKINCTVDCIRIYAKQHGAEDLLLVASHFGFHSGDNSRTDLLI